MKTLENILRHQDRRSLPPDWKHNILQNAVAQHSQQSLGHWLFPLRLRYGLAAAWIAIAALHAVSPETSSPLTKGSLATSPPQVVQSELWLVSLNELGLYSDDEDSFLH